MTTPSFPRGSNDPNRLPDTSHYQLFPDTPRFLQPVGIPSALRVQILPLLWIADEIHGLDANFPIARVFLANHVMGQDTVGIDHIWYPEDEIFDTDLEFFRDCGFTCLPVALTKPPTVSGLREVNMRLLKDTVQGLNRVAALRKQAARNDAKRSNGNPGI